MQPRVGLSREFRWSQQRPCHDWLATPTTGISSLPYAQRFCGILAFPTSTTSPNVKTVKSRSAGTKRTKSLSLSHTESLSNAGRKRILNTRNYATSHPTRKLIIISIQKCRQRSLLSAPPLRTWLPASTPSTCTREYVVSITQPNYRKQKKRRERRKRKQRR